MSLSQFRDKEILSTDMGLLIETIWKYFSIWTLLCSVEFDYIGNWFVMMNLEKSRMTIKEYYAGDSS